jgi:hypothetical protein
MISDEGGSGGGSVYRVHADRVLGRSSDRTSCSIIRPNPNTKIVYGLEFTGEMVGSAGVRGVGPQAHDKSDCG